MSIVGYLSEYGKCKLSFFVWYITYISRCSMTFCFSFDVLTKLNPIQVNIEGGGPKQGGGIKNRTVTSRYWKLQYGLLSYYKSVKETRRKK